MIFCFLSKEISRSVTAIESVMFCPHLMVAYSKGRYHLVQEVEEFWNIHQVGKALLQIKLPWNTRSTKSCNLLEIRKKARQIIGTYHQLFIFGRSFKWFVVKLEKLFLLLCVTWCQHLRKATNFIVYRSRASDFCCWWPLFFAYLSGTTFLVKSS